MSDTHRLRSSLQFRYINNQSLLFTKVFKHVNNQSERGGELLDFEGHKYEEVDCLVGDLLLGLNYIIFLEINFIHMSKASITLKYH